MPIEGIKQEVMLPCRAKQYVLPIIGELKLVPAMTDGVRSQARVRQHIESSERGLLEVAPVIEEDGLCGG